MEAIQQAQRAIEKACAQAFSWSVDHWLVIGLSLFGVYMVAAFVAYIGSQSR